MWSELVVASIKVRAYSLHALFVIVTSCISLDACPLAAWMQRWFKIQVSSWLVIAIYI